MRVIAVIFCDVGGVLGTNGWDHNARTAAVRQFGLDAADFERRHHEAIGPWEEGRMSIDEYLDIAVFYEPRPFTRADFRAYMFAQSRPNPDTLALLATLRTKNAVRMMALNNEPSELNQYRIDTFGLRPLFDAFLSSCWVGARKPDLAIYQRALEIAQANPPATLFIDDREENLVPARALGLHTIRFESVAQLRDDLAQLGIAT